MWMRRQALGSHLVNEAWILNFSYFWTFCRSRSRSRSPLPNVSDTCYNLLFYIVLYIVYFCSGHTQVYGKLVSAYDHGLYGSVRNVLVKVPTGVMLAKALAEAGARARARARPGRAFGNFIFNFCSQEQRTTFTVTLRTPWIVHTYCITVYP